MKFSSRGRIGHIRFSFVIRTVQNVQGITSSLGDGKHIIMWDFDKLPITAVVSYLAAAQNEFALPPIHIAQASTGDSFHAYCLCKASWLFSLHIVSGTKGIDPNYVSMAAWRQRWTLRLSDKGGGVPKWVCTLDSQWPEEATPADLKSWVDYEIWTGPKAGTDEHQGKADADYFNALAREGDRMK